MPYLVRYFRRERSWSMNELADRSKVSKRCIERIEKGQRKNPRMDTMLRLAKALDQTPQALFFPEYTSTFKHVVD